jgi:hypothetical protein
LLKRSFEGLGFNQGDYEDTASAALWLECHGLGGLDTVRRAWPRLQKHTQLSVALVTESPGSAVLDAGNASALICGQIVADLVCSYAGPASTGRVELRSCLDCDAQRFVCLAQIDAHAAYPLFERYPATGAVPETPSALVVAWRPGALAAQDLAETGIAAPGNAACQARITPDEFRDRYDGAVMHGLSIDTSTLAILTAAADNVLVEATERSRQGETRGAHTSRSTFRHGRSIGARLRSAAASCWFSSLWR